jgi:flavodoxin
MEHSERYTKRSRRFISLSFILLISQEAKIHIQNLSETMKLLANLVVLVAVPLSSAFTLSPLSAARRLQTNLKAVGIYYDSSTGNTETCAGYIGAAAGVSPNWIGDAREDQMKAHEALIVGAPTWHTGADTERSGTEWDKWLYKTLPNMDLKGKKVAIFGCGDQQSYSDYYCDAAGEYMVTDPNNFLNEECASHSLLF